VLVIQFEPDNEHKEDEADAGEDAKERTVLDREQAGSQVTGERAQQCRTEQDSSDDLTDYRRLPVPDGDCGKEAPGRDDRCEVQEDGPGSGGWGSGHHAVQ
jgi:hypothetical protein